MGTQAFEDVFDDYLNFLEPRLREAYRLLKANGSFFLHLDYREVHYCKVLLDKIFWAHLIYERNYLGLRLRGTLDQEMVTEARQYPVVCERSKALHILLF